MSKRSLWLNIIIVIGFLLFPSILKAEVVEHDISTGNLVIPGNSNKDYIVTGTTNTNYIVVGLGYHGSITLRNCKFNFSGNDIHSPIHLVGRDGQSNDNPLTIVDLILDGTNTIQNDAGGRACIQVDQGTQINISAINPCDNDSGILIAKQLNDDGGAAIGSLNHWNNPNEPTSTAMLYNQDGVSLECEGITAGGNVVVSSGKITTRGGHGAGIGGGYGTYYDGMIVIYGGIVDATADFDAAGVGSGCPEGTGVLQKFAPHSAVIALPPAQITAKGAGASPNGGVGHFPFSELGLAGTKVRVYIGDPGMTNSPIKVYTEDHTPEAKIYVDLSQDPDIYRVVTATVDPALLDINQVFFGTTDDSGIYSTTGKLRNNTTFFTDAISLLPTSYGHPFLPKVTTLPSGGEVQLQKLLAEFQIESFPSSPLQLGYSSDDAREKATCVKIVYNDSKPIENVEFDLANGDATDFDDLVFLAADSSTVIPAPTTLMDGDTYYIIIPIKPGKAAYLFSDVLRIIGVWNGSSTSYIRQIVTQIVGDIHTEYICQGGSYLFNGEVLTEEGMYTNVTTTTVQCQALMSVEILNLVVTPPTPAEFDVETCDEYQWNGINYTETGVYSQEFTNSLGCDSIVTINLKVTDSYAEEIDTISCDQYYWNDSVYYYSGSYTQSFSSVDHCDSVVTTHLDLNYTPLFTIDGDRWPIGGTELEWTLYPYKVVLDHPFCQLDSVEWSVDCSNMTIRPIGNGLKSELRIFTYLPSTDSVALHVIVHNRCGTMANTIWIHTTYFDVNEYDDGKYDLQVFPNPNSGIFHLKMKGFVGKVNVTLYDSQGLVVKDWHEHNHSGDETVTVDCSSLRDGIYTVRVNNEAVSLTKRIVVRK